MGLASSTSFSKPWERNVQNVYIESYGLPVPAWVAFASHKRCVCIVGGRKELFGRPDQDLAALSSEALQKLPLDLMLEWSENARAIVANGDPSSFFFVDMYTSAPAAQTVRIYGTKLGVWLFT